MATRPSTSGTSPSTTLSNGPYHISGPVSSSPPRAPFFADTNGIMTATDGFSRPRMPPIGHHRGLERNGSSLISSSEAEPSSDRQGATILLRKLPGNSDRDAVRNILIFAQHDLVECELVPSSQYPEDDDYGYVSAVAKFRTLEGAKMARKCLDGKRNSSGDATLIVEILQDGALGAIGSRRSTVDSRDSVPMRQGSVSAASGMSSILSNNGRQASRFNNTFQNMGRISPPNGAPGLGNGEFPAQNPFSPTSPVSTNFNFRPSQDILNTDEAEEDDLLRETIGHATGGQPSQISLPRRPTNSSMAVSRFASLSLNTAGVNGMASPPMQHNFASPRSAATIQSPNTALSATMPPHMLPAAMNGLNGNGLNGNGLNGNGLNGNGLNGNSLNGNVLNGNGPYQQYNNGFARHPSNYPPANPADQNPPCNTLYVGNLPIDTNEDELKALFSKQRGYKRLCFRTKQNGPMCFVEFEDVTFATKTLTELYGHMLHNSVKGGIRLSFSKNPLGVRSGQAPSMPTPSAVVASATLSGFTGAIPIPPGFTAPPGPPPGLAAPPGLTQVHPGSLSGFSIFPGPSFGNGNVGSLNGFGTTLSGTNSTAGFAGEPAGTASTNGYGPVQKRNNSTNGFGPGPATNGSLNGYAGNGLYPAHMMGR